MFVTRKVAELKLCSEFDYLKQRARDIQTQFLFACADIAQNTETSGSLNRRLSESREQDGSCCAREGMMMMLCNPILESMWTTRAQLVPMIQFFPDMSEMPPLSAKMMSYGSVPEPLSLVDVHTVPDMICIAGDACLRLFSKAAGDCVVDWVTKVRGTRCMVRAIGMAGDKVVFGSDDGVARVYDIGLAAVVEEWPAHADAVVFVNGCVIGDRQYLVTGSVTGEVCLWDGETLEERARVKADEAVVEAVPDGASLVLCTKSRATWVWDLVSDLRPRDVPLGPRFDSAPFNIEVGEHAVKIGSRTTGKSIELTLAGEVIQYVDWTDSFVIAAAGTKYAIWRVFYKDEPEQ